jgi:sigma-B regulation protein RsbU (phosphoserine phosphatase)
MSKVATIASLEKRLFLKERELGALLEVTQAITHNSAEADLYKIYQFTLIGQLSVRRLALYVLDEGAFRLKVNFGTTLEADSHFLPAEVADWCHKPTCLVEELELGEAWDSFELLVPVRQRENVQALVFVGTLQGDYASTEALSFLETLSNIGSRGRRAPRN